MFSYVIKKNVSVHIFFHVYTIFAFSKPLTTNENKFKLALNTQVPPLFIMKQARSGEKAISPNIRWDAPVLPKNNSTPQALTP